MSKGTIQALEDIRFIPTKNVLLSKIKFDEKNPNVLSDVKNEALSNTVNKYGFAVDPWLNDLGDGTYMVIDGEHRIKLLLEKGIKSVKSKIFKVKYVEVQMLRQIANKLRGEHDKTKDADEFKSIFEGKKLDEFAKLLGEPVEDFQSILEKKFDMNFGKQEEEIPEVPIEPKSKLGDIYKLGNHVLMCGDSTDSKNIEKLMNKTKANSVITDPPYGIHLDTDFTDMKGIAGGNKYKPIENDDKDYDPEHVFRDFGYCKEIFLWGADYFADRIKNRNDGSWIVWDKTDAGNGPNSDYDKMFGSNFELCWSKTKHKRALARVLWKGIFGLGKEDSKKRLHPTHKPTELIRWFLDKFTKDKDVVVDLFLGSGSTLIACEQTNRVCYGMELDPGYIDVIVERWENFTGKKAIKN